MHLDHPFARGEKVTSDEIDSGKLDNFSWIDKIVEETGVPYSLFKLTHAQKFYNRIFDYARKGCYIDYTAMAGDYDKRFDPLVELVRSKADCLDKISISSDLCVLSLERGLTESETPITLLNTIHKLVNEKGLKFEDVLPMVTTNALAPINAKQTLIEENCECKLLVLNSDLTIHKVFNRSEIIEDAKSL